MVASAIGQVISAVVAAQVTDYESEVGTLNLRAVGVKRTEEACRSIDVGIAVGDVAPDELTSP